MILSIPYETPSKKNSRVINRRTGRSFPSKAYREWHENASLWLKVHYNLAPQGDGPFMLRIRFYHGTNARCDSDNKASSILDLLVDLGVLPDDRWQVVQNISVSNFYEKGHPSVQIGIFPLTDAVQAVQEVDKEKSIDYISPRND